MKDTVNLRAGMDILVVVTIEMIKTIDIVLEVLLEAVVKIVMTIVKMKTIVMNHEAILVKAKVSMIKMMAMVEVALVVAALIEAKPVEER